METNNWAMCRERNAQSLVGNPSPQALRSCEEEEVERVKEQAARVASRKQCLAARTDTHINPEKLWWHAQGLHEFKSEGIPALRVGNELWLPSLTKKLISIDISLQKKTYFSTMESHCVHEPYLMVAPRPGVLGQHKINPMIFL